MKPSSSLAQAYDPGTGWIPNCDPWSPYPPVSHDCSATAPIPGIWARQSNMKRPLHSLVERDMYQVHYIGDTCSMLKA